VQETFMSVLRAVLPLASAAALLLAGCASAPDESRREAIEAEIDAILSTPLDPAEFGAPQRCLSEFDYRNFRALDDRRILFEGRQDKLWINTLRSRCPDLHYGEVLVVRSFSATRLCELDTFVATDWFAWPWYRRWPWHWGSWGTGMRCTLGEFQPITRNQLDEVETVLRNR